MRTIFLPTDFTSKSQNAMKYACDMFHEEAMHYVLIHSYDIPYQPNEVMVSSILETLKEEVEENLEEQADLLRSFLQNEQSVISKRMGLGSVVDMIRYNEDMEPDFVFMGTRGERRSARDYLIGSNTMMVLKSIETPVFAIPDGCFYKKYRHIVFGSDLKSITQDVLTPLKRVLDRTDADLTVVHVGEISPERKEKSMEELRTRIGERMSAFVQIASSEVVDGLQDTARDNDADLLVLVDRKRNFFQRIFHKSVTREIGWRTRIPMLVLHD